MRRVYLSFLGLGQYDEKRKKSVYRETVYELDGERSEPTRFVQVAEQMLLGWNRFDVLYIAATPASKETHFSDLCRELDPCRGDVELIVLDEDMSNAGQWRWFEQIFSVVQDDDELCIDLTHGYRSIPVVFSAAINFLQKTKQIRLVHVFYGAYEKDRKLVPLVDMRPFFDINIWADAMTRLTDDADARGLGEAAGQTHRSQFPELNDPTFIEACTRTTERIRNVDVNHIGKDAQDLLQRVESMKGACSPGAALLLEKVKNKYHPLARQDTGQYSGDYFDNQFEVAKLLLNHGLYMQGFTAMREFLVSVADMFVRQRLDDLFSGEWADLPGKKKKKYRKESRIRFAERFPAMLTIPEDKWDFHTDRDPQGQRFRTLMEPVYRDRKYQRLLAAMKEMFATLTLYRNGFDHAWTKEAKGMRDDIPEQADRLLRQLQQVNRETQRFTDGRPRPPADQPAEPSNLLGKKE